VALHSAFLPEIFGTHHSKMIIIFRRDDTAQVVIHTANMIPRDWTNMTQAVWQSPLLQLRQGLEAAPGAPPAFGTGAKFKADLLNYLRVYDKQRKTCKDLVDHLEKFDFSGVTGTLISSVPGRHKFGPDTVTRFGWPALKDSLKRLDVQSGRADVVVQVSSIATLGGTDKWLRQTLFDAMASCRNGPVAVPNFKVVFPTPDEIRRSLDGYASGGSIHTKIQSPQQLKQLQYLKPIFHHWANNCPDGRPLPEDVSIREAGRRLAAPHIKTYIRYGKDGIDWAMITSANLSKQAWGEAVNDAGEVRLASYEIGVLQWPGLYGNTTKMVPTFKKDVCEAFVENSRTALIPLRIPYDLPLQHYGPNEKPWVATANYTEPDRAGQAWVAWR
jgi:tyrosyl-DNA phosphodiesterase 1